MTGCAPKLYNVDMRYEPTKAIQPAPNDGRKFSLTVASFIDQRKIADTLLIGRVIRGDGTPIPILPKYVKPMEAVTAALRSLLMQAGYAVAPDKPAWDLQEANIKPAWGTLLVGGAVDELDVTCLDNLTMKRYTAKARVTLTFADVQKQRIFYRITSESSSSLDHIIFSEEKLQSQINIVLSDAMEKAIEGPEAARRIREALRQP
jgi:CheY-like chemotaxis protein